MATVFSCVYFLSSQSRIAHEQCTDFKRFKSIVTKGNVIGALRDFPLQDDKVQILVGSKGLPAKLIRNRQARPFLRYFTKYVRSMIRAVEYGRGEQVNINTTVNDVKVHFCLASLIDMKGVTKEKYDSVMKIACWMCETRSCLCLGQTWTEAVAHDECALERHQMNGHNGCALTVKVLGVVLGVGEDGDDGLYMQGNDVTPTECADKDMLNDECRETGMNRCRGTGMNSDDAHSDDGDDDEIVDGAGGTVRGRGSGNAVDT